MPMTIASTSGDTRARAVTRGGETVYLRDIDPAAAKLSPLAAFIAAHARIAKDRPSHEEQGRAFRCFHGEAQAVMHNLRPYIRKERGIDAKWASSISGYWRRGRTEETFREWKRELAAAESK